MIEIERLTESSHGAADDLSVLMTQLREKPSAVTIADLDEALADHNTIVLVAKDGERVIGTGTLCVVQKVGTREGRIENVVVSGDYRGQGIGGRLMHGLIDIARERGAGRIELTSRPSRVAAHQLYLKLGFKERETHVFKLDLLE